MSKGQFDSLKSKECFCGQKFERGEFKPLHTKTCELYQKYKNEYMTFDKINEYLNVQRLNKIELFSIYPYNMFCLCDYRNFFKQYPMNNRYYITDNGTRLTIDEIKSILNKDFLYQKYIVEGLDAIQINETLNNTFSPQTILEWIKRYGIKTRSTSDVTKKCLNKMKKTCVEKYGVENVSVLNDIKQKKIDTTIQHYGVGHHLQDKNIIEKMKQNLVNKYGVDNVSKIESVQDKKIQTCMKNYGVKNIFEDKEYIKECVKDKYGVDNVSKLGWIRKKKQETMHNNGTENTTFSNISVVMFNLISDNMPQYCNDFYYATHNGEKSIIVNDNYYCFDFVYNKCIIEFYGDYWHGNPKKYLSTDLAPCSKTKTYQDIWNYDNKRLEDIQSQGYQVHIVWESDFQNNPQKVINECCEFIKQNINS